jgi:sugar lactone lactonase YvrE
MKTYKAKLVFKLKTIVGEGAFWDVEGNTLLWVDILQGKIYRFNPENQSNIGFDVRKDVGSVVLTENGLFCYVDEDGLAFLDPSTGHIEKGPQPEQDNPHIRFNDAKCDPRGTLWAGTMAYNCEHGKGKLYEFDPSRKHAKVILDKVTISNGLVWDMERDLFYYIDSTSYQVDGYQYDKETGEIFDRKTIYSFDKEGGLPDGMAIDAQGMLWIALFGAGKVVQVDPFSSKIMSEVIVPAPKVTSCAFGGKDLNELYVTTASYQMTEEEMGQYPLSGSLFKVTLPVKGVPSFKMKYK